MNEPTKTELEAVSLAQQLEYWRAVNDRVLQMVTHLSAARDRRAEAVEAGQDGAALALLDARTKLLTETTYDGKDTPLAKPPELSDF